MESLSSPQQVNRNVRIRNHLEELLIQFRRRFGYAPFWALLFLAFLFWIILSIGPKPVTVCPSVSPATVATTENDCMINVQPHISVSVSCLAEKNDSVDFETVWNWSRVEDLYNFFQYCVKKRSNCEKMTQAQSRLAPFGRDDSSCALIYSLHGLSICYNLSEHVSRQFLKGREVSDETLNDLVNVISFWFSIVPTTSSEDM